MLFTLADAIADLKPFVDNGSCSRDRVVKRINEATFRLMTMPDSPVNATRRMRYCLQNNSLTLPREAERILMVDIDRSPRQVFGQAYEFLSDGPGDLGPCGGIEKHLVDLGDGFPTFYDPPSRVWNDTAGCECPVTTGYKLIAFSTEASDSDKVLLIRGKDIYSGEIYDDSTEPGEEIPINRWEGGVEGTIRATSTSPQAGEKEFVSVTSVVKPETAGFVSLYTYDAETKRMYFLAKYHPEETSPGYRRYRVTAPDHENISNVLCLIQLRYLPAKYDTDVLLVQNIPALKAMIMAINKENEYDEESATAKEAKAIRLISNQHMKNRTHDDNFIQVSRSYGFRNLNII